MPIGNTTILRQVDKFVREGNLQAAMSLIQKARSEDPENQYAVAYEERVRSLMGPVDEPPSQAAPAEVRDEKPVSPPPPTVPLAEIVGLLSKAYEALARSAFRGALDTLGQARKLDPTNGDITVLEEEIRAACSAPTMAAEEHEDHSIVRCTIQAYIEEATDLAGRGLFDEAMHLVARGFVLDHADPGLIACERLIETSRELFTQRQEEEAYARAFLDSIDAEPTAPTAEEPCHADRARELFVGGAFDDALTEIALGLLEDPASPLLKDLEQEIWDAKGSRASGESATRNSGECSRLIHLHILAADEFSRCADFTRALDSLAKAYVIDPTNVDVKRAEVRIRQQELRHHQQASAPPLKLIYHHDRVANGE